MFQDYHDNLKMGVRRLPHFIRSNIECKYFHDLPGHLGDLGEDLHVIIDGTAVFFSHAMRHSFTLWDPDINDNDARFKAAVTEECLAFVDGIAKVECIKATSVIFDGNAVGSARREE